MRREFNVPDSEKKYNSPWNIAADFNVDLSFTPSEIATMLSEYASEQHIEIDQTAISPEYGFLRMTD